jgi:tetratricopeptide (TPR) repeat protein
MESQAKTDALVLGHSPPRGDASPVPAAQHTGRWAGKRQVSGAKWGVLLILSALTFQHIWAAETPAATGGADSTRARIESAYAAAETAVQKTNSVERLWQFGRAAFDRAAITEREKSKAQFAEAGLTACRAAIQQDPASAPAHYYLALCLGELARTKTLGALRLVRSVEKSFLTVRTLDETFDYAGADRGLGLLYLEAPGWPTSIGDRKKSRTHLERAVALAPNYPDNRLSLLELLIRIKDHRAASTELEAIEALWPKAREKLSGDAWRDAWVEWESRKSALQARLQKLHSAAKAQP